MQKTEVNSNYNKIIVKVIKYYLVVLLLFYLLTCILSIIFGLVYIQNNKSDSKRLNDYRLNSTSVDNNSTRLITEKVVKHAVGQVLMESTIAVIGLIGLFKENYWILLLFACIVTVDNAITWMLAPLTKTASLTLISLGLIFMIPLYVLVFMLRTSNKKIVILSNPIYTKTNAKENNEMQKY